VTHVRAQITAALANTLGRISTTGGRVHVARPENWPLATTQLPALLLYADAESVATTEILAWPRRLERTLQVRVEVLAEDDDDLESTLSAMLAEIEAAIGASKAASSCGGLLVHPLTLVDVDVTRDADAGRTVGRLVTTWTGTYYTYSNAPETAIT